MTRPTPFFVLLGVGALWGQRVHAQDISDNLNGNCLDPWYWTVFQPAAPDTSPVVNTTNQRVEITTAAGDVDWAEALHRWFRSFSIAFNSRLLEVSS